MEYFWTFERNEEMYEHDFESKEAAQNYADEAFEDECLEQSWNNGDTASEEIFLIEYIYDYHGDRIIKQKVTSTVDFEYYHGDFEEHTVWHCGGGGV